MKAVIVAGGELKPDFLKKQLISLGPDDIIIAADKGITYLCQINIIPKLFVGDMDSFDKGLYDDVFDRGKVEVEIHPVRKDETDLRLAMLDACELHPETIYIYGATGGRLDHFLSAIYIIAEANELGFDAVIINEQNRIRILSKGSYTFYKKNSFGKYVSFLSFGGNARIKLSEGFSYYSDNEYDLLSYDTIGISNEIKEESATINVISGRVIMIESSDKKEDE